jgi:hypothetical protein
MNCVNHSEVEAEALCFLCQDPICEECGIELNGKHYCHRCLEKRVAADTHGVNVNTKRGAFAVLILSLLPGGGYMYLGLMNRGLQAMIIFFGTIFFASVANFGALGGLVVPILMFYSIFDSLQLAAQMNEGLFIEDKPYVDIGNPNWQNILGYILIGLGILSLFYTSVGILAVFYTIQPYTFIVERLVPPLIIIAIGAYILYRSLRKSAGRGNTGDSAQEN